MSRREEHVRALETEAGLTTEEAEAVVVPESGGLTTSGGSRYGVALDYLHTTHPETGNEVVFVPGEALPEWAAADQAAKERQMLANLPGLPPVGKRAVKGR